MPKIHLKGSFEDNLAHYSDRTQSQFIPIPGEVIECSTFKIEPTGVVYQVAPIGSAAPHASMGYYPHSMVSHITHDEQLITEADVTDDNA